jgi:hypothetical protein
MKHLHLTIIICLTIASTLVNAQNNSHFRPISPRNGTVMANNMPVLTWTQIECQEYEIWINGILMGKVPSSQNAYVPFPLSFGRHNWKVVAVQNGNRVESPSFSLSIEDAPLSEVPSNALLIRNDWKVESSWRVKESGERLSKPGIDTKSWVTTSIPATVLTALVRNGVYPNPYVDLNNMLIPDMNDDFNHENNLLKYSHIKNKNPWSKPYWYRNVFFVPQNYTGNQVWLNLGEINYKAEIWLNGHKLADTSKVVGMERRFKFNVTSIIKRGSENCVAIAIYPPDHEGKPAPEPTKPLADPGSNMGDGFIARDYTKWDVMGWDWQPSIRDRDMGITEDVFLTTTNDIELRDLYISSFMAMPDTTTAELSIAAILDNHTGNKYQGTITINVSGNNSAIGFEVPFSVNPNSSVSLLWDATTTEQLRLSNPKLWWPAGYGQQHLYNVSVTARTTEGNCSSVSDLHGIRHIETYIGANEREYKVNGHKIYLKGGNWVIDMMLNWNASRYEKEILLSKNANLNILRVWGPTGVPPKALFRAADKHGVLMWQDFLNDYWGTFKNTPGYQPNESLFEKASIDIVTRLRNHPSLIIWCGGNEGVNPRESILVNNVLKQYDPKGGRHYLKQSDGDGLHGGGPYHTLEPNMYFTDRKLHGFSSEIGPSGIPVLQSVAKFMPNMAKNWLPGRFPLDGVWAYHDANNWPGEDTRKFTAYDDMVRQYYGEPDTVSLTKGYAQYIDRCQLVNYDVYRASIEAINRQLWQSASGILLWKSNSSWPSMVWQIYDWYLQAHAGYYGAKKAAAMVHVQLNRNNNSLTVLNLQKQPIRNAQIHASLYNTDLTRIWNDSATVTIAANTAKLSDIIVPNPKSVNFVKIELLDTVKNVLADNFYWLAPDQNFVALSSLPKPHLQVAAKQTQYSNMFKYEVSVSNIGESLAFMVELSLLGQESRQEILPSLWSDNYISLLPGETKVLEVSVFADDLTELPIIQYKTTGCNSPSTANIK